MGHLEGIYGVYGPVGAAWEGPLGHSPGSVSWGLGYVEGIYGAYGPVGVEYGPVGQSSPIGPTPSSVSGELRHYKVVLWGLWTGRHKVREKGPLELTPSSVPVGPRASRWAHGQWGSA